MSIQSLTTILVTAFILAFPGHEEVNLFCVFNVSRGNQCGQENRILQRSEGNLGVQTLFLLANVGTLFLVVSSGNNY